MEKKPLFHFLPGTTILSLATAGCNLHCRNCQNHTISQGNPEDVQAFELPPDQVAPLCRQHRAPSIAYTYTEPLAYYEYTLDCCMAARQAGIRNVLVTAGYCNEKPLRALYPFVDAANIDLKAIDPSFYRTYCSATLAPVLKALELAMEMGVWVEVTNLLIPGLNDSVSQVNDLVVWVRDHMGAGVPLHFSRFSPRYEMQNLPPTPPDTLERARQQALDLGMSFVYVGNLRSAEGENTRCPNTACPHRSQPLVSRAGYRILENRLVDGCCPACGTAVPGVWR
jgi:pyruvate formate lyase activating enzyme